MLDHRRMTTPCQPCLKEGTSLRWISSNNSSIPHSLNKTTTRPSTIVHQASSIVRIQPTAHMIDLSINAKTTVSNTSQRKSVMRVTVGTWIFIIIGLCCLLRFDCRPQHQHQYQHHSFEHEPMSISHVKYQLVLWIFIIIGLGSLLRF
jgi:hypothetical protein